MFTHATKFFGFKVVLLGLFNGQTMTVRDYEVLLNQYQRLIERRESARMAQRMGSESNNVEFRIIEPPVQPVESVAGMLRVIEAMGEQSRADFVDFNGAAIEW